MKKLMDHERQEFQSEIRRMESNADELQAQLERTIEEHRATVEDYRQKIDALEKQLKSDKQFIEVSWVYKLAAVFMLWLASWFLERTIEEHRATVEDYRQKIDALEKQLKSDKQFIEVSWVYKPAAVFMLWLASWFIFLLY